MWDTSYITNAGVAMLASWVEGTTMNLSAATGGTGTEQEAQIPAMTELTEEKQTARIVQVVREQGQITIEVQFTGAANAYTLNQVGIWAKLGAGTDELICVYQDADGIAIPKLSTAQEFLYTLYCIIAVSNSGELTITVDTSAAVTLEHLNQALAEKQDIIDAEGILFGLGDGDIRTAVKNVEYAHPDYIGAAGHSNSYNDLDDKPTIPSKTSQLTNDSGYITQSEVSNHNTNENAHVNLWLPGSYYGTSETNQSTATKTVTCPTLRYLRTGCILTVKFTNPNTNSSPKLYTSAQSNTPIRSKGQASLSAEDYWKAGEYVVFLYDGSAWVLLQRFGDFIPMTQRAAVNGVATLASDGKVTKNQLRPIYYVQASAPSDTSAFWIKDQVLKYYDTATSTWKNVLPVWG